jgi:hypothetical protein
MSRPRSTDPSVALSIAVPQSLKTRLDQELSYKQSRSLWVQKAILAKLDAYNDEYMIIEELSSSRLCAILLNRQVISLGMFETLQKVIKAMSPVEETVTEQ